MEKNQIIEFRITDQSREGRGIGRYEGLIIFADACVYGDLVRAKVRKVKKRYALADVIDVLEMSKDRIPDVCPYIDVCGGCSMGRLNYEAQLKLKERHVRDVLQRIGGLDNPNIKPIISMDEPYNYRNKATLAVDAANKKIGFVERASHKVVDCRECRLQTKAVSAVAAAFRETLPSNKELKKIQKIVVKSSHSTGEVMVMPVVKDKVPVDFEEFIYVTNDKINEIPSFENGFEYTLTSFALDRETKKGNSISRQNEILAGRPVIKDSLLNLKFEISPYSFYQVNPVQAEKLYSKALEYADIKSDDTVLDLYCGVGTIGLFMAEAGAKKVIGIEIVKDAVLNANRNAVVNKIVNAVYYPGKAEEILPELRASGEIASADVVILDPPRKGCEESLLRSISEMDAKKIVYISCDPATLSRDVKILAGLGYDFVEATPVDMFPHTSEIEVICLISRKN